MTRPKNDDALILNKVVVRGQSVVERAENACLDMFNRLHGTKYKYSSIQEQTLKTAFRTLKNHARLERRIRIVEDAFIAKLANPKQYKRVVFRQIPTKKSLTRDSKIYQLVAAMAKGVTS